MDLAGSMKSPHPGGEDGERTADRGDPAEALIIFATIPRPGNVKKRLAREIGGQPAAALYNDLALHTFRIGQEALEKGWSVNLFHDPRVKENDVRAWVGRDFHFAAERGSEPGERIQHAFDYAFHRRAGKAIIISSDIPGLEFPAIEEAAEIVLRLTGKEKHRKEMIVYKPEEMLTTLVCCVKVAPLRIYGCTKLPVMLAVNT